MADLVDRLSGESEFLVPERARLPIHQFIGGQRLYALGLLSRSEIASEWDLQGDEITQAVAIADIIDAQVGASAKMIYIARVESIAVLLGHLDDRLYHLPNGSVDKAKAEGDLGI